jgi:hypothetical protein
MSQPRPTIVRILLFLAFLCVNAPESLAVDCSGHCMNDPTCERCHTVFDYGTIGLVGNSQWRVVWGPAGSAQYPEHWSQFCYKVDFDAPYRVDVVLRYTNTWNGALFDVYRDGQLLCQSSPVGSGWGQPHYSSVPYGTEVARASFIAYCGGEYFFEVRETSVESRSFQEACDRNMLSVGVRLDIEIQPPVPQFETSSEPLLAGAMDVQPAVRSPRPSRTITESGTTGIPTTRVLPNPGNGVQRIFVHRSSDSFSSVPASRTSLKIFDVSGRSVRRIDGLASSNQAEFIWDGKSDDGRSVPPGIYYYWAESFGARVGGRLLRMSGVPEGRIMGRTPLRTDQELPEDGEGGGGSPCAAVTDSLEMAECLRPFYDFDLAGRLSLRVQDAQNAGLSPPVIDFGQKLAELNNAIVDALNLGTFPPVTPQIWAPAGPWMRRLHEAACIGPMLIAALNGDCPARRACNKYFSSDVAARAYLVQEGFHLVPAYMGNGYAKGATNGLCPPGMLRYHGYLEPSGLCYTCRIQDPEPDPEYRPPFAPERVYAVPLIWWWHRLCN